MGSATVELDVAKLRLKIAVDWLTPSVHFCPLDLCSKIRWRPRCELLQHKCTGSALILEIPSPPTPNPSHKRITKKKLNAPPKPWRTPMRTGGARRGWRRETASPGSAGRSPLLGKHEVCILPPFGLKLGDDHSLPAIVEITNKSPSGLSKKVPMFGMNQNRVPPCLLFAALFALFVLSGRSTPGRSESTVVNI